MKSCRHVEVRGVVSSWCDMRVCTKRCKSTVRGRNWRLGSRRSRNLTHPYGATLLPAYTHTAQLAAIQEHRDQLQNGALTIRICFRFSRAGFGQAGVGEHVVRHFNVFRGCRRCRTPRALYHAAYRREGREALRQDWLIKVGFNGT